MKNYLLKQLQDLPNGVNWASLLYMHGPVDLLTREDNKPTNTITSRLFAESIIEVVGNAHLVKAKLNSMQDEFKNENNSLQKFKLAVDVLKKSDVVSFFKQSIANAEMKAMNANGTIDESAAYQHLLDNLENWYSQFVDRLTLWYKKKTRVGLFILGALLGLLVNVDSVQLFGFYNQYPSAKDEIINYYQNNAASLTALSKHIDSMNNNLTSSPQFDSLYKLTKNYVQRTDSLTKATALPVGWQYNIFHKQNNNESVWLKIIGILLSGFAASFGAPFWFELLKKIYSKS